MRVIRTDDVGTHRLVIPPARLNVPRRASREYVVYRRIVQKDPCSYCAGSGGTKDHIVPRAAGGPDHEANLTGSCRSCNSEKGSLDLLGFLFERQWGVSVNQAYLDDIMMKMVGMWMP
jgi:5-methylcytosine-specific restriction endonuclease McrA